MTAPSPSRRRSRAFLREMFGFKTWREFERELRRRKPIDTAGVEVCETVEAESPATQEEEP